MKKIIPLSFITIASLYATDVILAPINVESTLITEVSQNAKLSADLATALNASVPSIDMSRRSGIANDVFIRGQKRDNISVEVDGSKVFGACPNRMDPPISHILANQIDEVEVTEGPYDVTNFGTMSGGLKITTKKPTKDFHGEVNLGFGSWNYTKVGATVSGGNDTVRVLMSGSTESSDQYKDGNGDTLAQQTKNKAPLPNQYQASKEDMQAYKKKSVMAKIYVSVTDDQELQLSATKNRSDDVLYPGTPMDAAYDVSNIYSVAYDVKNISDIYKDINLQYYYSDVDHPMDTSNRITAITANPKMNNMQMYMTNQLQTSMQGLKLKNSFDIEGHSLLVGLDGSRRTWQGESFMTNTISGITRPAQISLPHTETTNKAVFAKLDKSFGDLDVTVGARYDSTDITPDNNATTTYKAKDYNAFNANIVTSYNLSQENKIFLGLGQASRVPDARELYMNASSNPNLNQTTNQEIDLGYELKNDLMKVKIKGFYSMLQDYIYLQKLTPTTFKFQNIDATIYGTELSALIYATDDITVDMGISYKKGQKDEALAGQTDKDLADIAPLRGNLALNYEYMNNSIATIETVASEKWIAYDSDNGEQELGAWAILNMKVKHEINKNLDFTLGVNNMFDKTYAQSNTYVDLVLLGAGTETMLMNELGRYVYTNLDIKF